MKKVHALLLSLSLALPLVGGCMSHEVRVEPITLEPIHMTLDVNLHVDHEDVPPTAGSESAVPTSDAPVP